MRQSSFAAVTTSLLIFVTLGCMGMSARADDRTAVYGRVVLEPAHFMCGNWVVKVTARLAATGKVFTTRDSIKDIYCCRVPTDARGATLYFEYLKGKRIGRWQKTVKSLSDAYAIPVQPEVVVELIEKATEAKQEATSDSVKQRLTESEAFTAVTRSYDLHQWAIAEMQHTYRDRQDLLDVVGHYLQNARAKRRAFMSREYDQQREVYRDVIALEAGDEGPSSIASVLRLVKSQKPFEKVFTGLRVQAIQALSSRADLLTDPTNKRSFLDFLRAQTPASLLFRSARTALARVGDETDRNHILKALRSPDPEQVLASLIAVREAPFAGADATLRSTAVSGNANWQVASAMQELLSKENKSIEASGNAALAPTYSVWANGRTGPGFRLQSFTQFGLDRNSDANRDEGWAKVVTIRNEQLLQIDYPGDDRFGAVQFYVDLPGDSKMSVAGSTRMVVDVWLAADGREPVDGFVKVGLSGQPPDPKDEVGFEESFHASVEPKQSEHVIDLRVDRSEQATRLANLKAVQIVLLGKEKKRFYLRSLHFVKAADGNAP